MRRPAPRSLALALESVTRGAGPQTLLARVQAAWSDAVGAVVAGESAPVAERGGAITVGCSSAVWAQELELLGPDLRERLNRLLEPPGGTPVQALRFRVQPPR